MRYYHGKVWLDIDMKNIFILKKPSLDFLKFKKSLACEDYLKNGKFFYQKKRMVNSKIRALRSPLSIEESNWAVWPDLLGQIA